MISRLRNIYTDYPAQFWLLIAASFIDQLGGFMIFPFFALYFTSKFNVSLTQAGLVFGIWSIVSIAGGTLGGALADRYGRKNLMMVGLVFSALFSLAMALVENFALVYLTAAIGGLFSSIGGPAYNATIADLLPEEKRADGYGVRRVAMNIAFAVAPAIGGLLVDVSYVLLFGIDALTSIITALFILFLLQESLPDSAAQKSERESLGQTFKGYGKVLNDRVLLAIIVLAIFAGVVYWQWYFSVPVFMRDAHGIPEKSYGLMMSIAGVIVILFQLPVTRSMRSVPPALAMALGTFLFAIGFGMFGFVAPFALFMLGSAIITFGEMIYFPTQDAIVARLAPEDMRGRYIAVTSLAFSIPNIIGPMVGGLVMDSAEPATLWYVGGILCLVAALGYGLLHLTGRLVAVPEVATGQAD